MIAAFRRHFGGDISEMPILKIARMGHPILRAQAEPVSDLADPAIQRLIQDMLQTMEDAGGTGLAAPQVHEPVQIVTYFARGPRLGKDEEEVPLTVLINPVLTPIDETPVYDWEGCLSVPGLTGLVPRWRSLHLSAMTADGSTIDKQVHGFHARVLQHECDHLAGILYPQRMDDMSLLMFQEEMRFGEPERAQALRQGSAC